MIIRKRAEDGGPLIWGGMLHRAPNGRECTIQTRSVLITPQGAQELRARVTRQTTPAEWDGVEPVGALIIWWSESVRFACGRCRSGLGTYLAYEAGGEVGVVESTSREYLRQDNPNLHGDPHARQISPNRPWKIDGEVQGRAAKTEALITCRKCRRIYRRNLRRLGKELWNTDASLYLL